MLQQRRKGGSPDGEEEDDDIMEEESVQAQALFSPGQDKKSELRPRSLFGSIFNAGNLNKLVNIASEVGTSLGNIVAPIPDDDEEGGIDDDDEDEDEIDPEGKAAAREVLSDLATKRTLAANDTSIASGDGDRSADDIKYQLESRQRMASLLASPGSPSNDLDEIDLSPVRPSMVHTASDENGGSHSPAPFSLSSALLSAMSSSSSSSSAGRSSAQANPPSSSAPADDGDDDDIDAKDVTHWNPPAPAEHQLQQPPAPAVTTAIAASKLKVPEVLDPHAKPVISLVQEPLAEIPPPIQTPSSPGPGPTKDSQPAQAEQAPPTPTTLSLSSRSVLIELNDEIDSLRQTQLDLEACLAKETASNLKLRSLLQEAEEGVKASEEVAWQAKAEASEMLFALEVEQEKNKKLAQQLEQTAARASAPDPSPSSNTSSSESESERREREAQLTEKSKQIADLQSRCDALKSDLTSSQRASQESSAKISALQVQLAESRTTTTQADETLTKLQSDLQQERTRVGSLEEALKVAQAAAEAAQATLQSSVQVASQGDDAKEKELKEAIKEREALKAQVNKIETESKQLHTIIAQLRQARRVTKEDVDAIIAERDALKVRAEALQVDSDELKRVNAENACEKEDFDAMQAEIDRLTCRSSVLQERLDEALRLRAELEKANFDLTEAQAAGHADSRLLQQEVETRRQEVENLHAALQQAAREQSAWKQRSQDEQERRTDVLRREHTAQLQDLEGEWRTRVSEKEEAIRLSNQRCQDEALLRRKAEMDLNAEKRRMKKTVDDALAQLKNSQEDVVDRTLIANLLASYFKRNRPQDVMQLIAKVLNFSDEQLEVVGLKVPDINLISSIYTTIVGPAPRPVDVEGDNLAELWVNFLEMEVNGAMQGTGLPIKAPPPLSPSHVKAPPSLLIGPGGLSTNSASASYNVRALPAPVVPLPSTFASTSASNGASAGAVPGEARREEKEEVAVGSI